MIHSIKTTPNRIPAKIRNILEKDKWMKNCCYCGAPFPTWHHPFIHAGKRVQEVWAIIPLCRKCHNIQNPQIVNIFSEYVGLARARVLYGPDLNQLYCKYKNREWKQEFARVAEEIKYKSDINIIQVHDRAKKSMIWLMDNYPFIKDY